MKYLLLGLIVFTISPVSSMENLVQESYERTNKELMEREMEMIIEQKEGIDKFVVILFI